MFVELHILQNFAPSCLNRDDTNTPKDCEFGGFRRARISSQCIKKAIRDKFKEMKEKWGFNLGNRTKFLSNQIADLLANDGQKREEVLPLINFTLDSKFKDTKHPEQTNVLLFLDDNEVSALKNAIWKNKDDIKKLMDESDKNKDKDKNKGKKKEKEAKSKLLDDVVNALNLKEAGKAVDISLFGRMIAELPYMQVDAACQVAHAISTNKISMEFDFFTAVDDLQPKGELGAAMMDTTLFNSACFYRYANVNLQKLDENLKNKEMTKKALEAFIRASIAAIPTGKQTSTAAQNPPGFIFGIVRENGNLWSLANAFIKPVYPANENDLMQASTVLLEKHWEKFCKAYKEDGIKGKVVLPIESEPVASLNDGKIKAKDIDEFISKIMEKVEI